MNYIIKFIILTILLINAAHADMLALKQITILSASSLTEPIAKLSKIYTRKQNITVTASFDATFEQARKIVEGGSADLFISSNPKFITKLKQQGLLDIYSISNLVTNKLALVVNKNSYVNKIINKDLPLINKLNYLSKSTLLVIADHDLTSLGQYSKNMILEIDTQNNYNLWNNIEKNIVSAASAKNALNLILNGNYAGITYYTDAKNNPNINILDVIDTKDQNDIIYQAAVVAGENMHLGRNFLNFLKSEEAINVFLEFGFGKK